MADAPDNSWGGLAARHAFGLAVLCAVFGVIFGPPLWRGECPGFRDAGHFYYPTLKLTTERWSRGEIPLWNPYDNAGQPLAADATSAVFYPGRAILHLPLSFERCITFYVACHWLLAIFGARRLSKRFSDSTDIQYLSGMLYGLSGYVAGQMFNVVFLVGAAWLPWAWDAWESLRVSREPRKAARLAVILAMMVLGGDPQIAYHVALLALLDSISWRRTAREAANTLLEPHLAEGYSDGKHLHWPWFRSRWVVLAFACLLAVGLAGIQVVPSMTWSLRSDRAAFDQPRSLWEWIGSTDAKGTGVPGLASLFAPPTPQTHDENLYDFSFAPVRVLEFFAPGVFGELGPHYQQWLKALTPSQRWWTSANYVGLLTIGAAAIAIWRQWRDRLVRAAACVAMIALLSSFGIWGFGALWNALVRQAGGAGNDLSPAAGGLYWFWVSSSPGYTGFRYPSKWLVFFSLAMVLLAAKGLSFLISRDEENSQSRAIALRWAPYGFCLLACAASIAWITLVLLGTDAFRSWGKTPAHPLYGPFDVDGALRCVRLALARTCCVSLVVAGLLFGLRDYPVWIISRCLMLFTIVEVIVAVWSGPIVRHRDYWMEAPTIPAFVDSSEAHFRVYRASSARLQPALWQKEFDEGRLAALRNWEIESLAPRYHWLADLKLVEARGTTMSAEYSALLDFLHRCPPDDGSEPAWSGVYHPYDLLAARYCMAPIGAKVRNATAIPSKDARAANASFWERKVVPPRAWIAASVSLVPEEPGGSRSAFAAQTNSILLENGRFRDLIRETLIESDAPDPLFSEICGAAPRTALEAPVWITDAPEQVELEVDLAQPGLLVLGDAYIPGWVALDTQEGKPARNCEIFRANRVFRGVCLSAGKHRVSFRYRPWEIPVGGVISLVSWAIFLPAATFLGLRRSLRRLHPLFRRRPGQGD